MQLPDVEHPEEPQLFVGDRMPARPGSGPERLAESAKSGGLKEKLRITTAAERKVASDLTKERQDEKGSVAGDASNMMFLPCRHS